MYHRRRSAFLHMKDQTPQPKWQQHPHTIFLTDTIRQSLIHSRDNKLNLTSSDKHPDPTPDFMGKLKLNVCVRCASLCFPFICLFFFNSFGWGKLPRELQQSLSFTKCLFVLIYSLRSFVPCQSIVFHISLYMAYISYIIFSRLVFQAENTFSF